MAGECRDTILVREQGNEGRDWQRRIHPIRRNDVDGVGPASYLRGPRGLCTLSNSPFTDPGTMGEGTAPRLAVFA